MLLGIYNFAYKFHSKADYQRYAHHNPKYKKNSKRKNKWNIGAVPNCCFIFIIPMNISTWKKNVFEPRPLHSGTFEPNTFQLFKSYSEFGLHNAKVSVKRPVLLIDLVWNFPKSFYQTTRSISEKNQPSCSICLLAYCLYKTTWFGYLQKVSIKRLVPKP